MDLDDIWLWLLRAGDAGWVLSEHDEDADTDDGLLHRDVADSLSNEALGWLTGLDHVAFLVFHSLSTGTTHLTRDDDLATTGASFHNEADDGVSSTAGWDTVDKLEAEGLKLVLGREALALDAVDEDLESILLEVPALHDHHADLLKAAARVLDELLGVGSLDDDLSTGWGGLDFTATIALGLENTGEEFVKFGVEEAGLNDTANLGAALSFHW